MQYKTISQTDQGRSAILVVDDFQAPFNIGISAKVVAAATFNIEYSMDDPFAVGYSAASATWHAVPDMSAISATTGAGLTIPCRAISIDITSVNGEVEIKVVQAGPV